MQPLSKAELSKIRMKIKELRKGPVTTELQDLEKQLAQDAEYKKNQRDSQKRNKENPEGRKAAAIKRSTSPEGMTAGPMGSPHFVRGNYRAYSDQKENLKKVLRGFIVNTLNLEISGLVMNTPKDPYNLIAINSDSGFCDRKEGASYQGDDKLGVTKICCSEKTKTHRISVLFVGNVFEKRKAFKPRTFHKRVSGQSMSEEVEDNLEIPEGITNIANALQETTISMPKKREIRNELVESSRDRGAAEAGQDDSKLMVNATLIINVGLVKVTGQDVVTGEENLQKTFAIITMNGTQSFETGDVVAEDLVARIHAIDEYRKLPILVIPMKDVPNIAKEDKITLLHCETLFADLVSSITPVPKPPRNSSSPTSVVDSELAELGLGKTGCNRLQVMADELNNCRQDLTIDFNSVASGPEESSGKQKDPKKPGH